MESLVAAQEMLMKAIKQLWDNYVKSGYERRTASVIKNRLSQLDALWQEFESNHTKINALEDFYHPYFVRQDYEQTSELYIRTRKNLMCHLELVEKGLTPSNEALKSLRETEPEPQPEVQPEAGPSTASDWAEESQPQELPPQPQTRSISQGERDQINNMERPKASPIKPEPVPTISHRILESGSDSQKIDNMLRRQQSNIKAFARTIFSIDIDDLNEKWEFEDALKTIQSRWKVVDSLHWEIDAELVEEDEHYNQIFYKYEKKFSEIKKQINSKMWSVSHREKSTPQMEIPTFNGNYHQWISFKDLFNEVIHNNRSMSNAQKMQFLKNKVRGEAEKFISHLHISSENYEACWDILNHRYNNIKLIFSAHINNLLSLTTMPQQSYTQIKRLHDTTNECLNAIKNLGVDIKTWDPLVVHILSQKLDAETHTEYVESLKNPRDLPTLKDFLNFLEMKFTSFESSRRKIENPKPSTSTQAETSKKPFFKSFGVKETTPKKDYTKSSFYQRKNCPVCQGNHGIFYCETFLGSKADDKRKTISKLNLCKNCLYNHYDKDCISDKTCRTCHEKHNTLVHEAYANAVKSEPQGESANKRKFIANAGQENQVIEILLATALIKIQSADGTYHTLRALIDQGSQTSIITENAAQLLQLPRRKCKGVVYGIGIKGNSCKGVITITASALHSDYTFKADLYVMKSLINNLPNKSFCKPSWSYLEGIQLADPEYYISRSVDLLLGADIYASILQNGIIKQDESLPVAQQTRLGWILCGNVPASYQCNIIINNIEDIQHFWNIEDITERSTLSAEDQYCQQFYQDTTIRQDDGRYVVRLPLNPEKKDSLGASKSVAIAQFLQLERKFRNHTNIAQDYKLFINEYIELGHMRECKRDTNDECNKIQNCYLPHHCVQRADSTTTSLRVVFNASAKTSSGQSLNDIMFSGPNLQQDLFSLILKWRQYQYAFTADVEKMFRQINLNQEDQSYQKIIWRDSPDQLLREYALTTVTYGTKAAPFLAMMTLRQLANDEQHRFPEAAKAVQESFYMDDLLHGCHSLELARKLQSDLITLMKLGGFNLRKWASNRPELLEGVSKAEDLKPTFEFRHQESTKTLGLRWHPQEDQFTFQPKIESSKATAKITKRVLLSNISKIFDPLGWLSPVTTKLKLLFQKVYSEKLEWDNEVSDVIKAEWDEISRDLENIKYIKMPRWLNTSKGQNIELHGFCDASTKAYACAIYCRVVNNEQPLHIPRPILIAAKSRLVPTSKAITLPRLELCAATLLSTLMSTVKESLSSFNIKVVGWSDSTAVLGWLQGDHNKWKPFVANRVVKIKEIMPSDCWNYIKSGENPADCASRGIKAEQLLQHPLWWNGPDWLPSYQNKKPSTFTTDQEIRKSKQCHVATNQSYDIINEAINKYSSLTRATRIVAWMLRMKSRAQNKPTATYLTTDELRNARDIIIKRVQETEFTKEINDLKNNQNLNSRSSLLKLKPFLDEKGMLRVGGRINNAHIDWEIKHPLLIPHSSRLTDLIIDQAHLSTFHGGARLTLARARQNYWIIGGNRATKKRLRLCVTCRKQSLIPSSQLMGDLPSSRLNPSRPFFNTGVDYTGFVNVKANKGRGIKTTKGYIAVFICMATKAVHLELVSDLSSESFLAALRRMSARRGAPRHIYSDNGTNFVGANKIIQREFKEIMSNLDETFYNAISDMNISWHFNAPAWPSAGGLWEAAVKSLKYHLCRVLGDQRLTFEEYSTLLSQIEACLNARPLCALTEDPEDIDYITPSHFLSSGPTINIIETERDERTRWRLTQKIFNDIWKRWQAEYLSQLQSRCKWTQPRSNIKVGDVVAIHDANLPAGKWALGRVLEVHPGTDGYVRVASVKTKNGVIKRPVIKLSILPVSNEQESSISDQSESAKKSHQNLKKQKPTRKSFYHSINFVTMAFMLFMLIITPVQSAYNVSNFKSERGIYFDKISNMRLARDEWKLVVYYDINPHWQGSDLFTKYLYHLEDICAKLKNQEQCKVVLLQLRHSYSELNYYNDMLLGKRSAVARKKRGLINGIGNIAHSLFGVLDETFADQYQKDIDLIKGNELHLANLWKNQTSIIEAETNLLKRVESAMEKHYKIFNQHLNNLETATNQLSLQVQDSMQMNEFTVSSIIANSILVNLKSIQDTLLDTITNVLYGKFNIHLLTPKQLKDEMNIIAGQVSKDLALPYDNINTDLTKLYQLMKIRTRMTQQYLIFEIKIPLVNRDTYELFSLIPIPQAKDNKMISIIPIADQVAINIQKESFIPIRTLNAQKCMQFDDSTLICPLQGPIYHLKSDESLCITDHVTSKCETDTEKCGNIWTELSTINKYLFFCCDHCTAKIICGQEITAERFSGTGIIGLSSECNIKGDSFTIYSHRRPSSEIKVQADIDQFEIPSINNVINLSVPLIGNESHIEEHNQYKKHINDIKQQIEQMKKEYPLSNEVSYHDIHHYVAIYIVAGVAVVMAALYVRHRIRINRRAARLASLTSPHLRPRPAPTPPAPAARAPAATPSTPAPRTDELRASVRAAAVALNKRPTSSYFQGL